MKQVHGVWLPDTDTHFESHLRGGGVYQGKKIAGALVRLSYPITGVALDIGAHVGLWSRELAKAFPAVVAFEPIREHVECFEQNMRTLDNVRLVRAAVADIDGFVSMATCGENSGNAHISLDENMTVPAVKIDSLDLSGITFMKIDVEGYELPVLRGARETITRDRPIIVVEQKAGHAARYGLGDLDAVSWLQQLGMRVLWSMSGDYCMGWK